MGKRGDELAEHFLVLRHGGAPHEPVRFGVVGAGIQREAELAHPRKIAARLLVIEIPGQKVQLQHQIPDEIVLHAPAASVECEDGALRTVRARKPASRHLGAAPVPVCGLLRFPEPLKDPAPAGDPDHGLGGEIDVPCQMAREVIGAQLFTGSLTVGIKVLDPAGEERGIGADERVRCAEGKGTLQHDEHVAAFLHRHLVAQVVYIRALWIQIEGKGNLTVGQRALGRIDLACGIRIAADIMGRKVLLPYRERGEVEDRATQGIDQFRTEGQKERDGGVADIDGTDAAVGIVLLGEEGHLALRGSDELMGSEGMAPCGRSDESIVVPADCLRL